MSTITFGYVRRDGTHCLEVVSKEKATEFMEKLWKYRFATTAWITGHREQEVGWIEIREDLHWEDKRRKWWYTYHSDWTY